MGPEVSFLIKKNHIEGRGRAYLLVDSTMFVPVTGKGEGLVT